MYATGVVLAYNLNPEIFVLLFMLFIGVLPICEGGTSYINHIRQPEVEEIQVLSPTFLVNRTPICEGVASQVFGEFETCPREYFDIPCRDGKLPFVHWILSMVDCKPSWYYLPQNPTLSSEKKTLTN